MCRLPNDKDGFEKWVGDFGKMRCTSVSVVPVVIGGTWDSEKHLKTWVGNIGTPGIKALLKKILFVGHSKDH